MGSFSTRLCPVVSGESWALKNHAREQVEGLWLHTLSVETRFIASGSVTTFLLLHMGSEDKIMKFTDEDEKSQFIFLYEQARTHYKNECHSAALAVCEEMNKIWPDAGPTSELIGHIYYFGMSDLDRSVPYYEKAIKAAPRAEMPSLGLFHVLWELNHENEAFDEMRRFLSTSNSQAYTELLDDMSNELNVAHSDEATALEVLKLVRDKWNS